MKAIITVGISGSGKSTWANSMESETCAVLERDQIRSEFMEADGLEPKWENWDQKWEGDVTDLMSHFIHKFALAGINLVISDTNLNPKFRNQLIGRLMDEGYDVEVKFFNVPVDECIRRDSEREESKRVGEKVIRQQWQRFSKEFFEQ